MKAKVVTDDGCDNRHVVGTIIRSMMCVSQKLPMRGALLGSELGKERGFLSL